MGEGTRKCFQQRTDLKEAAPRYLVPFKRGLSQNKLSHPTENF